MLKTKLGKINLDKPLVLASGILGTSVEIMQRVIDNGAGAVTTKSIGPIPRDGNPNPCVVEIENGIYNAVGLPTPGYENMDDEFNGWKSLTAPLIASIYGSTIDDYGKIAKHISKYKPSIIELNVSCPNKDDGMAFGVNIEALSKLIKEVKSITNIPIMPKLTPNCDNIGEIASACESAGADMICAINTVQKVITHPELNAPLLSYGKGGISGPIIKDTALEKVKEVRANSSLPILGVGGVTYGKDAIEMFKAGADAVGVGSAVQIRGIESFSLINQEIEEIMKKKGWKSIKDIKNA